MARTRKKKVRVLFTIKPHLTINSMYLGKTIQVYNGKRMFSFAIQKNMLGHKFGEYIKTKRCGFAIHFSGRKKKGGVKSGRRK
jgi:ribosomal protein S19